MDRSSEVSVCWEVNCGGGRRAGRRRDGERCRSSWLQSRADGFQLARLQISRPHDRAYQWTPVVVGGGDALAAAAAADDDDDDDGTMERKIMTSPN